MLPLGHGRGSQTSCQLDEIRILWNPTIRRLQFSVRMTQRSLVQHRDGATTEQLGPVRTLFGSQIIEPADQLVIKLDEDLPAAHRPYGRAYGGGAPIHWGRLRHRRMRPTHPARWGRVVVAGGDGC